MRFYRVLHPIEAIAFDLDDTLYDNSVIIQQAEQQFLHFLTHSYPQLKPFQTTEWISLRQTLLQREPDIYHDVTQWRWRTVDLALKKRGIAGSKAALGADTAMQHFFQWRNRIVVPTETHTVLRALKKRYFLVAITNGNADLSLCGLNHYFQFVLRAGPDGRAKPYPDMYLRAASLLKISPIKLLHVGDCLLNDVMGALHSGLQACWMNSHQHNVMRLAEGRLLPHIEISRLASLTALL